MTFDIKKLFVYIPLLIILILLNSFVFFHNFTFQNKILYLLITILNLVPLYSYYLVYKKKDTFPFFELAHLYFFFCYTFAIILDQIPGIIPALITGKTVLYGFNLLSADGNDLSFSMKIYCTGLIFFNLGYFIINKFISKNTKNYKIFKIDKNFKILIISGLLIYLTYFICFYFFDNFFIFKKFAQLKQPFLYMSIGCLYFYYVLKKNLNIIQKFIILFLIFIIIISELLEGLMLSPTLIILYLYLLNFVITKKLYFRYIIIFIIILSVLNTHKKNYRYYTWWKVNQPPQLTNETKRYSFQKIRLFIYAYKSGFKQQKDLSFYEYSNYVIDRTIRRLFHSYNSLIIVSNRTPSEIPYFNGESYKTLITKLIPRLIWKNKPTETFGHEFGKRYEILNEFDKQTSWNMPVLNEFYANFGVKGVSFGMLIMGILFGFISKFLDFKKNNILYLISIISLYPIFFMEVNLSLLVGITIQKFIFFVFMFFILIKILRRLKFI